MKKRILEVLTTLIKEYPNQSITTHLELVFDTALHTTDKELLFQLEKYLAEKELDHLTIINDFDYDDEEG